MIPILICNDCMDCDVHTRLIQLITLSLPRNSSKFQTTAVSLDTLRLEYVHDEVD